MLRPILGAFSAIALASLTACNQPPTEPPQGAGRYLIVHSPQVERDTILLDTATGKTWAEVELSDLTGQPVVWEPMPQLNADADWAKVRKDHPPVKDKADAILEQFKAKATTEAPTKSGNPNPSQ